MIIDVTKRLIDMTTGLGMIDIQDSDQLDEKGVPIKIGSPFTLRLACIRALLSGFRGEENEAPEKKLERYELAERIMKNDKPKLSHSEIAEIKGRVAKAWIGALICGQVTRMLDEGKPEK